MRKKRPCIASLDEVRIGREGDDAVIDYNDPAIAGVHPEIGPEVHEMTDQEILDVYNETIETVLLAP